jgi:hypothetical protein
VSDVFDKVKPMVKLQRRDGWMGKWDRVSIKTQWGQWRMAEEFAE